MDPRHPEAVLAHLADETFESYCHGEDGGCPLYYTRMDVVPPEHLAMLDAAGTLKERALARRLPSTRTLADWKFKAYLVQEYCRRRVRQEEYEEEEAEREAEAAAAGVDTGGRRRMAPVRGGVRDQVKNSDSGVWDTPGEVDEEADG